MKYFIMRALIFIFIAVSSFCQISYGQFSIIGEVKDSATKKPIEHCQLGLLNSTNNQLINIATTDTDGKYKFNISKPGFYRITVNSLTHKNVEQEVLFLGSKEQTIKIDLLLSEKAIQLNEIIISAKLPPIIIKEDTIIYHIEKWTHASDENLEDVLRKMPGFELLKDGEIKLNGKPIDKVLVNGKEILDAGAALTTRSLAPDMIKRIEVRLKEKSDQYKESILSSNDLVVLDIKLKDELNLSLFGKATIKAGIQNKLLGGSYINVFSLGKKNKTHILGEYDQFGLRTISISQLKNIDRDSYLNLFSLPADYKSLTEREEYNKEIYGFKDYSLFQPGSISVTNKFSPSNNFDIYIVSFNSFVKESILDKKRQTLFQSANSQSFFEEKTNKNLVSKNRLEIKYTLQSKLKAEYNIIYSLNNNLNNQINSTSNDLHYIFNSERNTTGVSQNWQLEYNLSKRLGFHVSKFLDVENSIQQIGFKHNDIDYFSVFFNNQINNIMHIEQDIQKRSQHSASNLFIRYSIERVNINLGVRVGKDQLKMEKESSSNTLNLFTGKADMLLHHQVMPYSEVNYATNKLRWRGRMGINYSSYPSTANQKNNRAILMDYISDFSFNINNFDHIGLLLRQNLSTFSLQKLVPGSELINFQTISFPGFTKLTPQTERLVQLSYSTSMLQKWGIGVVAASVYGTNNNSDRYEFSRLPFIGVEYRQLGSSYVMNNLILTKVFDKFPMSIKVEAGYIKNWQKNLDLLNKSYNTQTRITLMKLVLRPLFDNKSFDMSLSSQYQFFKLGNGTEINRIQTYISTHFSTSYSFIKKRMFINAKFKSTNFTGIQKANYFDLFLKGQYKKDKLSLSIEADNLLNNHFFFKREINPAYQIDIQRQTFSRYIAFSFEFRLR